MRLFVRITNFLSGLAVLGLLYWVFGFLLANVFGLRVLGENATQSLTLSIFVILAILSGSMILNVMLNMTRIADSQEGRTPGEVVLKRPIYRNIAIAALLVFPLIATLMFGADYLEAKRQERNMIDVADSWLKNNKTDIKKIGQYSFDEEWINETSTTLKRFRYSSSVGTISAAVIVNDQVKGKQDFLRHDGSYWIRDEDDDEELQKPEKINYIFVKNKEEEDYFKSVFQNGTSQKRFSAHDGAYELFYPVLDGKKKFILYFHQHKTFAK